MPIIRAFAAPRTRFPSTGHFGKRPVSNKIHLPAPGQWYTTLLMRTRTLLAVTVTPRSSRSSITRDERGDVKAHLNSPPADGRANEELIKLLARILGIAKSRISIEKGDRGRKKILLIEGMTEEEVRQRI